MMDDLLTAAKEPDCHGWIVGIRRQLHQIPELAFHETKTSEFIRGVLDELQIPYTYPIANTGIVARLGDGQPTVALRADMDALPIREATACDYVSKHDGKMHACGHDAHIAMLLGAAKLLKAREHALRGTVLLVFQPAEEDGGGGKVMVEAGVLHDVSAVFGMHVWPALPAGTVSTRCGTLMAACDSFEATIRGRGGHGAMPHLAVDPIVAASHAVIALQPLVSRETSPTNGAVVTVARFNSGEGASNVIPEQVQLAGTVRTLSMQRFHALRTRVDHVMRSTAAMYGCTATIKWDPNPYPPLVNDAAAAHLVAAAARCLVGPEKFVWAAEPSMAAEDFSFMTSATRGAFSFLGIGKEDGSSPSLHSPFFEMDDAQLSLGAALHTATALMFFEQGLQEP